MIETPTVLPLTTALIASGWQVSHFLPVAIEEAWVGACQTPMGAGGLPWQDVQVEPGVYQLLAAPPEPAYWTVTTSTSSMPQSQRV